MTNDRQRVASDAFVKVRLGSGTDGPTETLWAVPVGGDRFRLDNVPWFAYRVSLGDVVEATEYAPGMYDFVRVIEASGNRAIRIILANGEDAKSEAGAKLLDRLKELGCGYEGATPRFIGVTIPPNVDLQVVVDVLMAARVQWEYANPTYDDLFASTSAT